MSLPGLPLSETLCSEKINIGNPFGPWLDILGMTWLPVGIAGEGRDFAKGHLNHQSWSSHSTMGHLSFFVVPHLLFNSSAVIFKKFYCIFPLPPLKRWGTTGVGYWVC